MPGNRSRQLGAYLVAPCLVLAGCASAQDSQPPERSELEGCWMVEMGTWHAEAEEEALPLEPVSQRYLVRISDDRLSPEIAGNPPSGAREAVTFIDGRWHPHPFAYWVARGDTVELGHPAAYAGITLHLEPRGVDLHGRATAHSDVLRDGEVIREVAGATAIRTACPDDPSAESDT